MIVFKKIKYKNYKSSGNHFVEISLNTHTKTLFTGINGTGKSTIISAICFVLFGKSYGNELKPTLVNSINKKDCLVELEFSKNKIDYKIRRGIKPNIFEIYENDKLILQTALNKDYQKYLEENIIKLNYNTFKQIIIIGSGEFVPFMKLGTPQRREVIENLLDLTIFSTMNNILKEKISENKKKKENNDNDIYKINIQIKAEKDKLIFIENEEKQQEIDFLQRNEEIDREISTIDSDLMKVEEKIIESSKDLDKISTIEQLQSKSKSKISVIESSIHKLRKTKQFYENNSNCPTCNQEIELNFKTKLLKENNDELQIEEENVNKEKNNLEKISLAYTKLTERMNKKNQLVNLKTKLISKKETLLKSKITERKKSNYDKNLIEQKIDELVLNLRELEKDKEVILEESGILNTSALLLKDTGVKSKIISNYINFINKRINYYLNLMDFYVKFEIDENFNEKIKSRHRDIFKYENFSEGQKSRIDLALLFTWRDVAKSKNSMDVNLLIFDEVADSSLDKEGVDCFQNILSSLKNTNTIVMSHNSKLIENSIGFFDRVIKFNLNKNFTNIEEEWKN